jgi:hypothetical protein
VAVRSWLQQNGQGWVADIAYGLAMGLGVTLLAGLVLFWLFTFQAAAMGIAEQLTAEGLGIKVTVTATTTATGGHGFSSQLDMSGAWQAWVLLAIVFTGFRRERRAGHH